MASEVDVVNALRECAEAWEPDVCVLGNVQARDVVAVCERLRAAEAERDEDRRGFDERSQALAKEIERAEQAEKERDQARERESYALAAIERNDEVHAEALRAVRQRAERAEQTRDAHAEALARAAREAGDAADRIAALTMERDDARSLLAHAERAIEQGTGDCLLVDHLKRALMERDEARAALIRSQEDHRAAVEALETYEERIGDIADHVLGLVPPDVPSIVKLDAIERRCGEERVAARQAERERDEARAEIDKLHGISLDVMRERDEARAALIESVGAWTVQLQDERSRAEAAEARWSAEQATALEALRQAEAAEARVRELEAASVIACEDARREEAENAALRAVADAAAALVGADYPPSWSVFKPLVDALAARGKGE